MHQIKSGLNALALFNGKPVFDIPRSTSNLVKPDLDRFLEYSKLSFDAHQFTNNGPCVRLLEERLAKFHEAEYCLTFSSGFWAIALAIQALALANKTEIIVPSLTYRRMPDLISWLGLTPHFCDIDSDTLAMSVDSVEACINDNTAIILGVHPIVNCCYVQNLTLLAESKGIPIVFDSVESVFESVPEGRIGNFGNAECFSMHACKLINGFGGGYLTTNNRSLYDKLKSLRTFGFIAEDTVLEGLGLNAKLNEIHAAMALASLDDINLQVTRNRARYEKYLNEFTNVIGIDIVKFDEEQLSGYKNIVARINDDWPLTRDNTIALLNAEKILVRAHYFPPLHERKMPTKFITNPLKNTNVASLQYINLPCGHQISLNDIEKIASIFQFIRCQSAEINIRLNRNVK